MSQGPDCERGDGSQNQNKAGIRRCRQAGEISPGNSLGWHLIHLTWTFKTCPPPQDVS
jgi:hypothetical protein